MWGIQSRETIHFAPNKLHILDIVFTAFGDHYAFQPLKILQYIHVISFTKFKQFETENEASALRFMSFCPEEKCLSH